MIIGYEADWLNEGFSLQRENFSFGCFPLWLHPDGRVRFSVTGTKGLTPWEFKNFLNDLTPTNVQWSVDKNSGFIDTWLKSLGKRHPSNWKQELLQISIELDTVDVDVQEETNAALMFLEKNKNIPKFSEALEALKALNSAGYEALYSVATNDFCIAVKTDANSKKGRTVILTGSVTGNNALFTSTDALLLAKQFPNV